MTECKLSIYKQAKRLYVYILAIIICASSNFSLYAYTKEDLERARNIAGVVELMSVLPLEFIDTMSPACATFFTSIHTNDYDYTQMVGNLCSRSLEIDENIVSMIARFLKTVRLKKASVPTTLFIVKALLMVITNHAINNHFEEQKNRIKRRFLRGIAFAIIDIMLNEGGIVSDYQIMTQFSGQSAAKLAGIFISNLISNGMAEYLGEKIIQGVEESETQNIREFVPYTNIKTRIPLADLIEYEMQ